MTLIRITSAQQLYVAFYGRPADVEGRRFWESLIQQNQTSQTDYASIAQAFGESIEAVNRFGSLDFEAAVNCLFNSILNRDADAAGRDFYVEELRSGRLTLPKLAIAIVEGIQEGSADAATFQNKVAAADFFTNALDTPVKASAYDFAQNSEALVLVSAVIAQVDQDLSTIPNRDRIEAIIEQMVAIADDSHANGSIVESSIFLSGGDGNNRLEAIGGNATLLGFGGDDTLLGGSGNDSLTGGTGIDLVTGGSGQNHFVYRELSESLLSGFDSITDFKIGSDYLEGPNLVSAADVQNLGSVESLSSAAVSDQLTAAQFVAYGAATFTFGVRTFVALNDGLAGFQSDRDAIIEITGFSGSLSDLSIDS